MLAFMCLMHRNDVLILLHKTPRRVAAGLYKALRVQAWMLHLSDPAAVSMRCFLTLTDSAASWPGGIGVCTSVLPPKLSTLVRSDTACRLGLESIDLAI